MVSIHPEMVLGTKIPRKREKSLKIEQQGQEAEEKIRRGEVIFNEGKLDEAERYFLDLLSQYPSIPDIKNNLGTIKYLQGDIITAKEFFLSTLAVRGNDEDTLANLKELYKNYGTWEKFPRSLMDAGSATDFFAEAFKLDPQDPGIQNDIGIIQLNAGQTIEAEKSFRSAINLDPTYQEAFYNLGKVLMTHERYVEAIDNFVTVKMLDPENGITKKATLEYQNDEIINRIGSKYKNILIVMDNDFHNIAILSPTLKAVKELHPSSSITLFRYHSPPSIIEKMENVDSTIMKPDERFYDIVMFTIGSANVFSEFKTWFNTHCEQLFLSSPTDKYNEPANFFHLARCLGYTKSHPCEYPSNERQDKFSVRYQSVGQNQRAIFLGGTGRSGTTLITRLLNKHHALAAFGEVKVVMNGIDDLLQIFRQAQISRKKFIEEFRRKWSRDYYEFHVPWESESGDDQRRGLVRWFSREEILDCLPILNRLNVFQTVQSSYQTYGDFIQTLFNLYAQKSGKLYWAEKTPVNAIYAPILTHCFSDMKIVNMVRDGRDVACSLMKVGWGTKNPYRAIDWWATSLIKALEGQKYLSPENYLNVRYEDLIDRPEDTMRKVIHFLKLEWDDNMLNESVYSKSLRRYKNELNHEVQQYALGKYNNLLGHFNYI